MKKYIAALSAAILVICSFTACADKTGKPSESSVSQAGSQAESQSESQTEPQSAAQVEFDKADAEKKASDAINGYFDALNSGDMETAFAFQYNKDDLEAAAVMNGFGKNGGTSAEALTNMIDTYKEAYSEHTITLNGIADIEAVPDNGYELLDELYGRIKAVKGFVAECGDTLDIDKITEQYAGLDENTEWEKQTYEESYLVTADMNVDDEQKEQEMIVFRTTDGQWKIDMSVVNYLQKVEHTELDNKASDTCQAATQSISDMKAAGVDTSGTFMISSDDSKNYLIPDGFDVSDFKKRFSQNYAGEIDGEYFIVINKDSAVYGVFNDSEGKQGIYPLSLTINKDDKTGELAYDELEEGKTYTIDELYDICKSVIDSLDK